MSSRPNTPPRVTPPTTTSKEPAMTEAHLSQTAALPSFDQISSSIYDPVYSNRNLPLPSNASPHHVSSPPIFRTHSSESVQLLSARNPQASPRERLQSAPLDRILSVEAQTPPRQSAFPSLGPAFEPQFAASRSLKRTRDEFSPSEESPLSPLGRSPSYPSKRVARDARVESPVRPVARMHTPHASIASISSGTSVYSPTQQRRESIPRETQPQPVARWVGESAPPPSASSSSGPPPAANPSSVTPTLASSISVSRSVERSVNDSLPIESPLSERWEIFVRQQPVAARACGFGERDRRVIDPPPIVQLRLKEGVEKTEADDLRYPFNVVHCTLWSADSSTDETALTGTDRRTTRRLMGTLVSSPFVALDENNTEGCFFVFPDLSCRTHGTYRLKFVLMRLEPTALLKGSVMPIIAETMTDAFTVYTAKEFPGMRPSTGLTKALKRQGCAISVKKGNEKALSAEKNEVSDGEDAPSPPSASKKRKRGGD